jgi:copper chaperone
MSEVAYHVPEMMCDACETSIRRSLESLEGVQEIEIDLAHKRVRVRFDESQSDALTIRERIELSGFDVG